MQVAAAATPKLTAPLAQPVRDEVTDLGSRLADLTGSAREIASTAKAGGMTVALGAELTRTGHQAARLAGALLGLAHDQADTTRSPEFLDPLLTNASVPSTALTRAGANAASLGTLDATEVFAAANSVADAARAASDFISDVKSADRTALLEPTPRMI